MNNVQLKTKNGTGRIVGQIILHSPYGHIAAWTPHECKFVPIRRIINRTRISVFNDIL